MNSKAEQKWHKQQSVNLKYINRNIQYKERIVKRLNKNRDMWDSKKYTDVYIMGLPGNERRKNRNIYIYIYIYKNSQI